MEYTSKINSPMGAILLAADEKGLIGAWFEHQKYEKSVLSRDVQEKETAEIRDAKRWLDVYFQGREPDFTPELHLIGSDFRQLVWGELLKVPYGETVTYGELAAVVAGKTGRSSMSAQAIGGAVSHNPVSIIVPCHRVIGQDGSLTGYAGGIDRKRALLKLEGAL